VIIVSLIEHVNGFGQITISDLLARFSSAGAIVSPVFREGDGPTAPPFNGGVDMRMWPYGNFKLKKERGGRLKRLRCLEPRMRVRRIRAKRAASGPETSLCSQTR
jgi:hypothetical protein